VLRLLQTDAPTEQVTALLTEIDADPLTPLKLPAGIAGDGMGQNLTAPAIRGMIAPWPGWRPDCVLVVADPRAMLERAQSDDGAMTEIPTYNYVPIEGGNLPPFWRIIWERITPVAMSDFGRQQLETLLGQTLVERTRRVVRFTVLGNAIVEKAHRVLREAEELADRIVIIDHGSTVAAGTLRLASPIALGSSTAPLNVAVSP